MAHRMYLYTYELGLQIIGWGQTLEPATVWSLARPTAKELPLPSPVYINWYGILPMVQQPPFQAALQGYPCGVLKMSVHHHPSPQIS